tara:strand:+ start:415 stop:633 length:219 start_codon:yes stop_codon:yes gene_type:complete
MKKINFKFESEYDLALFLLESNLVKKLPTLIKVCSDYFNHIRVPHIKLVVKAFNDFTAMNELIKLGYIQINI